MQFFFKKMFKLRIWFRINSDRVWSPYWFWLHWLRLPDWRPPHSYCRPLTRWSLRGSGWPFATIQQSFQVHGQNSVYHGSKWSCLNMNSLVCWHMFQMFQTQTWCQKMFRHWNLICPKNIQHVLDMSICASKKWQWMFLLKTFSKMFSQVNPSFDQLTPLIWALQPMISLHVRCSRSHLDSIMELRVLKDQGAQNLRAG